MSQPPCEYHPNIKYETIAEVDDQDTKVYYKLKVKFFKTMIWFIRILSKQCIILIILIPHLTSNIIFALQISNMKFVANRHSYLPDGRISLRITVLPGMKNISIDISNLNVYDYMILFLFQQLDINSVKRLKYFRIRSTKRHTNSTNGRIASYIFRQNRLK